MGWSLSLTPSRQLREEKHPEKLPAVQPVGVGTKKLAHSGTKPSCRLISGPHPVMELCSVEFRKSGLISMWSDGLCLLLSCCMKETHDSQLIAVEKVLPRHCEIRGLALFH